MRHEESKDVGVIVEERFNLKDATIFRKRAFLPAAEIARELVARWGIVAADVDGEDSAGRQKARLQTPEEIVLRACVTADILIKEFEKRDWFVEFDEPEVIEPRQKA